MGQTTYREGWEKIVNIIPINASQTKNPGTARIVIIHLESELHFVQTHITITPIGNTKTKRSNVTKVRTPFEGPVEVFVAITILIQNQIFLSISKNL